MSDDGLIDLIRREAAMAVAQMHQPHGIVVCTSYDPKKHTMRGILVPHGLETGDIVIGVNAIGNGYGEVTGPKVGSAEHLDGDQFVVSFGMGDGNMPIATHRVYSNVDKPPVVQSGEWMRRGSKGQTIFYDQTGNLHLKQDDGNHIMLGADHSILVKHGPSGSNVACDKDGNWTHDMQGKSFTVSNTSGVTIQGDLNVSGSSSLATGTLGGAPIATV